MTKKDDDGCSCALIAYNWFLRLWAIVIIIIMLIYFFGDWLGKW